MPRKITAIVLSFVMFLFIASFSWSYESNANRVNPSNKNDKRQREYTPENASKPLGQGGYYGGHDTIMGEAAILKKGVHSGADKGKFEDFINQSLPNLRTGAHDEDSKKWWIFGYIGSEAPIGPNGDGDYMNHFYDPETGKGLGKHDSALQRAKDYATAIKNMLGCKDFCKLDDKEKAKLLDMVGRIGHMIADMAVPEHV